MATTETIAQTWASGAANYCKMSDGTMIVYGIATCTENGATTVNYPVSFSATYADNIVGIAVPRYNRPDTIQYGTTTRVFMQALVNRCSVYFRNASTGAAITDTNETAYFVVIGRWK